MIFQFLAIGIVLANVLTETTACNGPDEKPIDKSTIKWPSCENQMSSTLCRCAGTGAYYGKFANGDGEREETCCCHDGCCWNNCRTQIPPEGKCVQYFDSATWTWDYKNKFWVLTDGPKQSLIPKKPSSGCPSGTHSYYGTCCCEDACCWNNCRSADPNNHGNCLKGTDAIWVRNSAKGIWVAQIESKA